MEIIIGSARHDENGAYVGGADGDNIQKSTNDMSGEVSMQKIYKHSKGWYILRPLDAKHANAIADKMTTACNNNKIGYDQGNRYAITRHGISTKIKTECDCSSLVRQVIKEATGIDPGNFTTFNEVEILKATGLFGGRMEYVSQSSTPLYNGDVLVTKTTGHTAIVVSGNPRSSDETPTVHCTKEATDKAKSFDRSIAGEYKCTAKRLNVRHGAGTNKDTMVLIINGTKVRNYGYYTEVDGVKWLYVRFQYRGVTYTGFCSINYLEKV